MSTTEERQHIEADVTAQRLGRVYAEALFACTREQSAEILEVLDTLVTEVFRVDAEFEAFLSSAAITREQKDKAIRGAFEGRVPDVFVNFLLVLNDHGRLELLRPIRIAYRDILDEQRGRMRVHVRVARPLTEEQAQRLSSELRAGFNREPVLHTVIDPELLGGLVVQVDDWLYDASVRTRLQNLQQQLIESSSHEIQSGRNRFSSQDGN